MNYRYNSHWIPKDFDRDYDAHIYFSAEDLDLIEKIQTKVRTAFPNSSVFVGDIIPEPIGPHPQPMLEINFTQDFFQVMLFWLIENREHLNVLVHPLTGNDYWEHTQGAIWLGQSLQLDLSRF